MHSYMIGINRQVLARWEVFYVQEYKKNGDKQGFIFKVSQGEKMLPSSPPPPPPL